MIPEAQRAEIRRSFHAEHWRIGTIARELALHPDTVRAALGAARFNRRILVHCPRPRPAAEVSLRLRTLPGEQARVGWGHFGKIQVGRAKRALSAFREYQSDSSSKRPRRVTPASSRGIGVLTMIVPYQPRFRNVRSVV